jgi:hypothetical protein
MRTVPISVALLLACAAGAAHADCPAPVISAVKKRFPEATIEKCKAEREDGHDQFEAKIVNKGARLEVEVAPDGAILQVEEKVALASVPAAVTRALAARYPKSQARRAEKQTRADGAVWYEIGLVTAAGDRREATFKADGTFVEEERD